jgi:hypothetical protein
VAVSSFSSVQVCVGGANESGLRRESYASKYTGCRAYDADVSRLLGRNRDAYALSARLLKASL